jgi:hypothetical protein
MDGISTLENCAALRPPGSRDLDAVLGGGLPLGSTTCLSLSGNAARAMAFARLFAAEALEGSGGDVNVNQQARVVYVHASRDPERFWRDVPRPPGAPEK